MGIKSRSPASRNRLSRKHATLSSHLARGRLWRSSCSPLPDSQNVLERAGLWARAPVPVRIFRSFRDRCGSSSPGSPERSARRSRRGFLRPATRSSASRALAAFKDPAGIPILTGDAISGEGLDDALAGVDIAYYLIHSMERDAPDLTFADREHVAAVNFAAAAARANVSAGSSTSVGSSRVTALPRPTWRADWRSSECCFPRPRTRSRFEPRS